MNIQKWLYDTFFKKFHPVPEEPKSETVVESGGFIHIEGAPMSNGRIELTMDWDDEFIKYLRANGFNGTTDENVVQQYIAVMHRQLLNEESSFE